MWLCDFQSQIEVPTAHAYGDAEFDKRRKLFFNHNLFTISGSTFRAFSTRTSCFFFPLGHSPYIKLSSSSAGVALTDAETKVVLWQFPHGFGEDEKGLHGIDRKGGVALTACSK